MKSAPPVRLSILSGWEHLMFEVFWSIKCSMSLIIFAEGFFELIHYLKGFYIEKMVFAMVVWYYELFGIEMYVEIFGLCVLKNFQYMRMGNQNNLTSQCRRNSAKQMEAIKNSVRRVCLIVQKNVVGGTFGVFESTLASGEGIQKNVPKGSENCIDSKRAQAPYKL